MATETGAVQERLVPESITRDDFMDVPPKMRWECIRCGTCCGNNFTSKWLDHCVLPVVGPLVDNHCRYFDRAERKCTVYVTRPAACRGHPFALRKTGEDNRLQVHSKCPGIGHGPVLELRPLITSMLKDISDLYDMDFIVDWETLDSGEIKIYRLK